MKKAVVRLQINDGKGTFGTGVFIGGEVILTARHVIDPENTSLKGNPPQADTVSIESPYWMGRREADELSFGCRRDVDLGAVILRAPKSIQLAECAAVHAEPQKVVNVGDEATVYGFNGATLDVQTVTIRAIAIDGATGAYVCDKALPGGFSGGPVFAKGGLVGIAFAQHFLQGQSYFYGGDALLEIAHANAKEINWASSIGVSPLVEYPKGPAVGAAELHAGLYLVMEAYQRQYLGPHAETCLARANSERLKCDPGAVANGIVEIAVLPQVNFNPTGFWHGAFVEAGLKSPRMLAALLLVSDPDLLSEAAREQRDSFLEKLKRWKQLGQ